MLVKTIKDGVESEWFELTKRRHRELLKDKPNAAVVRLEDIYRDCPERGQMVTLEFSCFTALVRDFVLMENAQAKQAERHHDKRAIENIDQNQACVRRDTVEENYIYNEYREMLSSARGCLTRTQQRRLSLYIDEGLSMREIAALEKVHNTAVEQSIKAAVKKLREILTSTSAKANFLSD